MSKIRINVYTNMDNKKENVLINAIKDNNVIKYIDSDYNKYVVNIEGNILIKENKDFFITIDFPNNLIKILMKEYNKEFKKEIETIELNYNNNNYFVKYKLIDEKVINEYKIKIL